MTYTEQERAELAEIGEFARFMGLYGAWSWLVILPGDSRDIDPHAAGVLLDDLLETARALRAPEAATDALRYMAGRVRSIWLAETHRWLDNARAARLAPLAKAEAAEVDATSVYNADNDTREAV